MKKNENSPFIICTFAKTLALFLATALLFLLSARPASAGTYNWNTTSGNWDTSSSDWSGAGSAWSDSASNNAVFANTATPSAITLAGNRTAGTITIGNASNDYNYTFTSISGTQYTINCTALTLEGNTGNGANEGTSDTILNGVNLNTNGGLVEIGRGILEFGGTGTFTVGAIEPNSDWGGFRMTGTSAVTTPGVLMGSSLNGSVTGWFALNGGTLITGTMTAICTGTSGTYITYPTINGATIQPSQSNSTFLTVAACSYPINGAGSGNYVYLGSNGVIFNTNGFNIGTTTTFENLSGSVGTLTKSGGGTLTLSSAQGYTGNTTVNGGTLQINAGSALVTSPSVIVNSGGTLAGDAGDVFGFTAGEGVPTINDGTIINITAASRVTLWNGITMTGGLLTGTGAGDTNGLYSLSGTVTATSDTSGNAAVISGGNISLQNQNTANGTITFKVARGSLAPAADLTVSANLVPFTSSTGNGITKAGNGIMVLTGNNTYTGATTISGGTLEIGNGTAVGSLSTSSAIIDNGILAFDRPDSISQGTQFSGAAISGTGTLVQNGSGTVTLTAANTFTGPTTINAGTLQLSGAGRLNSGSYAGSIANAGAFEYSGTANQTLSGNITGAGNLTKDTSAASTLTLSGSNTYTGATTISAGTLLFAGSANIGSVSVADNATLGVQVTNAGASVLTGTSLTLGVSGPSGFAVNFNLLTNPTAPVVNLSSGLLTVNGTVNVSLANTINLTTANNSIELLSYGSQAGAGTFNLTTASAGHTTFSLNDTATALYLNVQAATNIWTGAVNNTWDIGTAGGATGTHNWSLSDQVYLDGDIVLFNDSASQFNVNIASTVSPSGVTFANSSAHTYTLSGAGIGGAGALLLNGTNGTVILTNSNSYTGLTSVGSSETLQIGNGTTDGSISSTSAITDNGALVYDLLGSQTLAASISGSGSLTMSGTGTLALSALSSYTGATNINSGTLQIGTGGALSTSSPITDNGTLVFTNSTAFTQGTQFSGAPISGTGSLIQSGSGTLTLNVANTYTGATTISAGSTLQLAGTAGALSASGTIVDNGMLYVNRSNAAVQGVDFTSAGITGGGGVIQAGSGSLTLNGSNSYTGATTLTSGSLVLQANAGNTANGVSSAVGSSSAMTLGSSTVLQLLANGNTTFQPASVNEASGSGPFNFYVGNNGSGTGNTIILANMGQFGPPNTTPVFNISGANGYTLQLGSGSAGAGALNFYNPTTINSNTAGVTVSIPGGMTVNYPLPYTLTLGGSGNFSIGALVQDGATNALTVTDNSTGTVTLNGANTYTGATTVSAGTLNYPGSLTGGGAIAVGVSGGVNATLNIQPGASIGVAGSANVTVGNGITNATGQGFVYQTGGNFTGIGELQIGAGASGSSYGYYNLSSGTLGLKELDLGSFNGASTGVFDISGGTMNVANWIVPARGGNGSTGILNMTGGTLNYSGSNSFAANWGGTGETFVLSIANASFISANGVNVNLMSNGQHSNLGEINLLSGGNMQINGIGTANTWGSTLVNFNGGTLKAYSANSSFLTGLTGGYVYSGGGTIDNNGVNITIGQALQAPTGNGVSSVAVTNGGSGYVGAPAVTFSGNNDGQNGTGAAAGGAAGYATVSGGVITGIVITNPGTGYTSAPTITLTGGGGSGATFGALSTTANTSGGMTFQGAGTTTLTGSNTYSGGTVINAGTVQINTANSLGAPSGSATINNGATLEALNAIDTSRNFSLSGNATINADSGVYEIDGAVTDGTSSGTLVKGGAGILDLTASNSYSGGTVINAGTVQIASNNNLGTGSVTMNNGATLEALNAIQTSRNFSLSGDPTIQVDSGIYEIDGALTDGTSAGTLVKTGAGALDLTASNSYSGGTVINSGTVQINTDSSLGATSGAATINNGGTLEVLNGNTTATSRGFALSGTGTVQVDGSSTYSISGNIGDGLTSGSLVKTGSGTLGVGGVGITGNVTVNNGTLIVSGGLSGVTSPVTVNSGGTLGGGGTINESVNVNQGGTIAPGAGATFSGGTTLSIYDNLTLSGTANVALTLGNTTNVNDSLSVNNLSIDPTDTLTLTVLGTISGSEVYTLATYAGTESGTFGNIVVNNGALDSISYGSGNNDSVTVTLSAVPEPGTWAMMLGGLGMLVSIQRIRRRNF